MAEFEIVDDFTYEVCLLPREKALGFVDHLNSIGIKAKIKESYSGHYGVFVTNELDMARAKREVLRFAGSPFDSSFTKASWEQGKTVRNVKEIKSSLYLPMSFDITSLTTIVELICIALYAISLFNEDWVIQTFALSRQDVFSSVTDYYRLLTPAFVHFGFMHIAFNLVMFEALGRPIEKTFGKSKLFSLIISIALLSNVLQYCFMTDNYGYFGGLSGVVYGIIGYCGVLSKREDLPDSFMIPRGLLTVSIIFILLGFLFSGIANLCHLGGVVIGILWGFYDLKKKNLF